MALRLIFKHHPQTPENIYFPDLSLESPIRWTWTYNTPTSFKLAFSFKQDRTRHELSHVHVRSGGRDYEISLHGPLEIMLGGDTGLAPGSDVVVDVVAFVFVPDPYVRN
jgi:hypothetical protein